MKKIVILGSTGSIGTQTLEVVEKYPKNFKVIGLAAHSNYKLLAQQAKKFNVKHIALYNEDKLNELKKLIQSENIYVGQAGINFLATLDEADLIVSSIVGTQGILSTYEAVKAKKNIALANKESLVFAGDIIMPLARKKKCHIIPIDSEHSAIWNLLKDRRKEKIKQIVLTASGGPFFNTPIEKFKNITIEEALKHPKWNMGAKISIDSATMLNKGFEVIEAHHLFDIDYKNINVVVHPQSLVHSMIKDKDGFYYAQIGPHDMRFPILSALFYDKKMVDNLFEDFDITDNESFQFFKPDYNKFPLLQLAFDVGKEGGILPAVFAVADDLAVEKFLNKEIAFTEIPLFIKKIIDSYVKKNIKTPSIDELLNIAKEIKETHASI